MLGQVKAQGMLPVSVNGKWGFINQRGVYIHQPIYNAYFIAENGSGAFTYYVKSAEGIKILSPNGAVFQSLGRFVGEIKSIVRERYVITKSNKYYSLYNLQGAQILIDSFDNISNLRDAYFLVRKGKRVNLSNGNGELILEHYVQNIQVIDQHFFVSERDSSWLMDSVGNRLSPKMKGAFLAVNKWGSKESSYLYSEMAFFLLVKHGNLYEPFKFQSAATLNPFFVAYSDTFGKSLLHHASGKQQFFEHVNLFDLPCINRLGVSRADTTWLFDSTFTQTDVWPYANIDCDEELLLTYNSFELAGFSNLAGQAILKPRYYYISNFFNHLAIYQSSDSSGFGVMNQKGMHLVKDDYDLITLDSQLIVGLKGRVKYFFELDKQNNIIGRATFNNVSYLKTGRINSPPRLLGNRTGANNRAACNNCNWFKNRNTNKHGLMNDDSSIAIAPTLDGYSQIGRTSFYLVWRFGTSAVLPNSGLNVEGRAFGVVDYATRQLVLNIAYNYIDTSAIRKNNGLFKVRLYSLGRGNELLLNPKRAVPLPYKLVFSLSNGNYMACNSRSVRFGIEEDMSYGTSVELFQQLTLESPNMLLFGNNADGRTGILSKGEFYLLDPYGRLLNSSRYDMIKRERYGHMVFLYGGFYGLINNNGVEVLQPTFNYISDHQFNASDSVYFTYVSMKKMGVINKQSKVVLGAEYTQLQTVDEQGYTIGRLGTEWFLLNLEGKKKILKEVVKVLPFNEGLAGVRRKNKWGFIDYEGHYTIEPIYNRVSSFKNGKACVKQGNEYFYIDASGERITDLHYSEATDYFGEYALVANKGLRKKFVIIDSKGLADKEKFRSYEYQKQYQIMMARKRRRIKLLSEEKLHDTWYTKSYYTKNSSHILFKTKGHEYHIFNEEGQMTGKIVAKDVKPFEEGYCIVKLDNKQAVINPAGEIVYGPTEKQITQVFDSFVVVRYDKYMYIERFNGETINFSKAKFITISNVNNIVQIKADGRLFLASEVGIFDARRQMKLIDLKENVTAVRTTEGMRILDSSGFYNNQKVFSKINTFRNGYAVFDLSGNYGLFQLNNTAYAWLLKCNYDKLEIVSPTILKFEKDNAFGYINLLNKQIIWSGLL